MSADTGSSLVDLSATELSAALQRRELSSREVVAAFLDRIDGADDTLHALVSRRDRADVEAEAVARDEERAAGRCRGWLHGIPVAVKDLVDARGLPTTHGFHSLATAPVATSDEGFVGHLRASGAIVIGKTNTPEFGIGSHTYNGVAPTTGNVTDPHRSAGGSSGGAAVAVAAGMVPVADGSDFMGSLRNPPGWNGVLGMRPSSGVVGDAAVPVGVAADDLPSGVNGPIARTTDDLRRLLATMSGGSWSPDVPDVVRRPRIAWLGDWGGALAFEEGILQTCESAVSRWSDHVDGVGLPYDRDAAWAAWLAIRHHEVGGWLLDEFTAAEIEVMKPEAQWEIAGARALTARQLDHAREVRRRARRGVAQLFDSYDLVAMPTAQVWPFPIHLHWPSAIGGVSMDTYHRWMEVTTLATLAALPAVAVPAGTDADGLHIGVQLVGRPGGDAELLSWIEAGESAGAFSVARPSAVVELVV